MLQEVDLLQGNQRPLCFFFAKVANMAAFLTCCTTTTVFTMSIPSYTSALAQSVLLAQELEPLPMYVTSETGKLSKTGQYLQPPMS